MLRKWHADDVAKYSFIDECKIRGGKFCIVYRDALGNKKERKLVLRSSIPKLQKTIKEIRMDSRVTPYGKAEHGQVFLA